MATEAATPGHRDGGTVLESHWRHVWSRCPAQPPPLDLPSASLNKPPPYGTSLAVLVSQQGVSRPSHTVTLTCTTKVKCSQAPGLGMASWGHSACHIC